MRLCDEMLPNEPDSPIAKIYLGFSCGFLVGAILVMVLANLDHNKFEREAIDAGVAAYVVDKYGSISFVWLVREDELEESIDVPETSNEQ